MDDDDGDFAGEFESTEESTAQSDNFNHGYMITQSPNIDHRLRVLDRGKLGCID